LVDRDPSLTYVEGFATTGLIPVLHAWNVTSDGVVVDNTWRWDKYRPEGYCGIRFPLETVNRIILRKETYGLLEDWENGFPLLTMPFNLEDINSYFDSLGDK